MVFGELEENGVSVSIVYLQANDKNEESVTHFMSCETSERTVIIIIIWISFLCTLQLLTNLSLCYNLFIYLFIIIGLLIGLENSYK